VLAGQQGLELGSDVDVREIAALDELTDPTARQLQTLIDTAGLWAHVESGAVAPIRQRHLLEAAHASKRNYDRLEHELVALRALQMASFQFLLPWRTRTGLRPGYKPPAYVDSLVDSGGRLDAEGLERRIQEIGQLRWTRGSR
jgi:hypothetical protein